MFQCYHKTKLKLIVELHKNEIKPSEVMMSSCINTLDQIYHRKFDSSSFSNTVKDSSWWEGMGQF